MISGERERGREQSPRVSLTTLTTLPLSDGISVSVWMSGTAASCVNRRRPPPAVIFLAGGEIAHPSLRARLNNGYPAYTAVGPVAVKKGRKSQRSRSSGSWWSLCRSLERRSRRSPRGTFLADDVIDNDRGNRSVSSWRLERTIREHQRSHG